MRWEEEVELVQEEMRRILAYLDWQAGWWAEQESRIIDIEPEQRDGLKAYTQRQAALRCMLHTRCCELWEEVPQFLAFWRDREADMG